jgi:hypothetical protein
MDIWESARDNERRIAELTAEIATINSRLDTIENELRWHDHHEHDSDGQVIVR